MRQSLTVMAVVGVGAAACGGSVEASRTEPAGRVASALACSAAGTYVVPLVGQKAVRLPDDTCTGPKPFTETATVTVTPTPVAGEWKIRWNNKSTAEWTVKETNGIIDWRLFVSYTYDLGKIDCVAAQAGSITVRIDESTVTVRHYCRWLGTTMCPRYQDTTGTIARSCAPAPDAGAPDSSDPGDAGADAAAEPDATAAPDAGTSTDASTPSTPDSPRGEEPPSEAAPPASSTSGGSSTPTPEASEPADTPGAPSCSTTPSRSGTSLYFLGVFSLFGLALGRRRLAR